MDLTQFRGFDQRLTVDSSEKKTNYLLAGEGGAYISLSARAYYLLEKRHSGATFEEIAEDLNRNREEPISPEQVEEACEKIVSRLQSIEEKSGRRLPGFLFRKQLIPENIVQRIAGLFVFAFHPAFVVLALGMSAYAVYLGAGMMGDRGGRIDFTPGQFWMGYGLCILSILVHEIGHASACMRFGALPSHIGLTLYLIFPALYSNVTSAWELKRWQRVVVDISGAYFQVAFAGVTYILLYRSTQWEPLWLASLMMAGSLAFTLNPILKFDGYWMLADALGVTNLGRQPKRIILHFYKKLRRRPVEPLPWPLCDDDLLAQLHRCLGGSLVVFHFPRHPLAVETLAGLPSPGLGSDQRPARIGGWNRAPSILRLDLLVSCCALVLISVRMAARIADQEVGRPDFLTLARRGDGSLGKRRGRWRILRRRPLSLVGCGRVSKSIFASPLRAGFGGCDSHHPLGKVTKSKK